jgi:hypothetical protein
MFFLAKSKPHHGTDSSTRAPVNINLWQHISSRIDRDAVGNNDARKFCKRVKTAITGKHSRLRPRSNAITSISTERFEQASPERHQICQRTRLLRPLKQAWRKAIGKTVDSQPLKYKDRTRSSLSAKLSNVASAEEDNTLDISDAALFPPDTEHYLRLEPLCSHTTRSIPPQISQIEISSTISLNFEATANNTPSDDDHSSTMHEALPSSIAYHTTSQPQSSCSRRSRQPLNATEHYSAAYNNTPPRRTQQISLKRRGSKTLPARPRTKSHHRSATSTWASSSSPTRIRVTSTHRTDYNRLMRILHPAPASRIPIPVAWRHVTPRTRSFRDPSSPPKRVPSIRVRTTKTLVRKRSQAMRPDSALLLQAIAARPASCFYVARRPTIKRANSQVNAKRHVATSTLGRRSIRAAGIRLKRQKTLPLDWRFETWMHMGSKDIPPMPTLGGSVRSRFLPHRTVNDQYTNHAGKRDVCGKVSTRVEVTPTDDEGGWESDVSGNEIWFDASDIAVVDGPSN